MRAGRKGLLKDARPDDWLPTEESSAEAPLEWVLSALLDPTEVGWNCGRLIQSDAFDEFVCDACGKVRSAALRALVPSGAKAAPSAAEDSVAVALPLAPASAFGTPQVE